MSDLTVANTILAQLGGNRFVAMTGAKNLLGSEKGLHFAIGTGAEKGINRVRVELNGLDLYTVTFFRFSRGVAKEIATRDMVPADALRAVFTAETGFSCTLGTLAAGA